MRVSCAWVAAGHDGQDRSGNLPSEAGPVPVNVSHRGQAGMDDFLCGAAHCDGLALRHGACFLDGMWAVRWWRTPSLSL